MADGNTSTHGIGTEHVTGESTNTDGMGGEVGDDTTGGKAVWDPDEIIPDKDIGTHPLKTLVPK